MQVYRHLPTPECSYATSVLHNVQLAVGKRKPSPLSLLMQRADILKLALASLADFLVHTGAAMGTLTVAAVQVPLRRVWGGVTVTTALSDSASHLVLASKSIVAAITVPLPALVSPQFAILSYRWLALGQPRQGIFAKIAGCACYLAVPACLALVAALTHGRVRSFFATYFATKSTELMTPALSFGLGGLLGLVILRSSSYASRKNYVQHSNRRLQDLSDSELVERCHTLLNSIQGWTDTQAMLMMHQVMDCCDRLSFKFNKEQELLSRIKNEHTRLTILNTPKGLAADPAPPADPIIKQLLIRRVPGRKSDGVEVEQLWMALTREQRENLLNQDANNYSFRTIFETYTIDNSPSIIYINPIHLVECMEIITARVAQTKTFSSLDAMSLSSFYRAKSQPIPASDRGTYYPIPREWTTAAIQLRLQLIETWQDQTRTKSRLLQDFNLDQLQLLQVQDAMRREMALLLLSSEYPTPESVRELQQMWDSYQKFLSQNQTQAASDIAQTFYQITAEYGYRKG